MNFQVWYSSATKGASHIGDKDTLAKAKKLAESASLKTGLVIVIQEGRQGAWPFVRNIFSWNGKIWKQLCAVVGA